MLNLPTKPYQPWKSRPAPIPRVGDVAFLVRREPGKCQTIRAEAVRIGSTDIHAQVFAQNDLGLLFAYRPHARCLETGEEMTFSRWAILSYDHSTAELEWNPDPAFLELDMQQEYLS